MMTEWLVENAAPVIRYRTMTELTQTSDNALLRDAMTAVLALPQTQKRLALLKNLDYTRIHGSNHAFLENILPMLTDFGLHYGMDAFRREMANDEITSGLPDGITSGFNLDKKVSYPFFLRAKIPVDGLLDFALERIDTVYDFTRHKNYDIYDDAAEYRGVPKPFRDRPIIKPSIAHGDNIRLPLIYDIVALAELYDGVSLDVREKIDNIIEYVLSPEYDIVADGYGILTAPQKRYYSMGWDCKKPFNDRFEYAHPNIHCLLLYARFPIAAKSRWFQNAIDFLTQYKTAGGTYIFPKEYLPEYDGNWVLGCRMSLAENRRKKNWCEIESTFYMLKLLAAQHSNG